MAKDGRVNVIWVCRKGDERGTLTLDEACETIPFMSEVKAGRFAEGAHIQCGTTVVSSPAQLRRIMNDQEGEFADLTILAWRAEDIRQYGG